MMDSQGRNKPTGKNLGGKLWTKITTKSATLKEGEKTTPTSLPKVTSTGNVLNFNVKKEVKVFGVPLQNLVVTFRTAIPEVVSACVKRLEKGLDTKNLFLEQPNNASKVEMYKQFFDSGRGDNCLDNEEDFHVVAHLLLTFLQQLPQPLLTDSKQTNEICIEAAQLSTHEERIKVLRSIVHSIPPSNRLVLAYILSFLNKLLSHSSNNKLNEKSLGRVFGPLFFYCPPIMFLNVSEDTTSTPSFGKFGSDAPKHQIISGLAGIFIQHYTELLNLQRVMIEDEAKIVAVGKRLQQEQESQQAKQTSDDESNSQQTITEEAPDIDNEIEDTSVSGSKSFLDCTFVSVCSPQEVVKYMRVIFPFKARKDYELSLKRDQLIEVIMAKENNVNGWWVGKVLDDELVPQEGLFPSNYCQLLSVEGSFLSKVLDNMLSNIYQLSFDLMQERRLREALDDERIRLSKENKILHSKLASQTN